MHDIVSSSLHLWDTIRTFYELNEDFLVSAPLLQQEGEASETRPDSSDGK